MIYNENEINKLYKNELLNNEIEKKHIENIIRFIKKDLLKNKEKLKNDIILYTFNYNNNDYEINFFIDIKKDLKLKGVFKNEKNFSYLIKDLKKEYKKC